MSLLPVSSQWRESSPVSGIYSVLLDTVGATRDVL